MKRLVACAVMTLSAPLMAQTPEAPAKPSSAAPATTPIAVTGVTPLEGGSTFISPVGEPFRSPDSLSGAEHWFRQADANHDGRITPDEMKADADRFFATLDVDHDGDIGPDELTRYETEVAPEIRVASTVGDLTKIKTDDDGNVTPPPYPTRLGAGRFGYLDMPEPVVAADTNFDRGISKQELETAALKRLKMLDANGDGALTRDDLPKLSAKAAAENPKRRRGDGGGPRPRPGTFLGPGGN